MMSIEAYDKMMSEKIIDRAIHDAEQEVAEGAELLDAKEALSVLRRKHFG